MTPLRSSLLLLVLAALLTAGVPATAGTSEPAQPVVVAPQLDALLGAAGCPEIATTEPALLDLAAPPAGDFILCTCKFCKDHPDVDCQISPDGFSILCADWYAWRCQG